MMPEQKSNMNITKPHFSCSYNFAEGRGFIKPPGKGNTPAFYETCSAISRPPASGFMMSRGIKVIAKYRRNMESQKLRILNFMNFLPNPFNIMTAYSDGFFCVFFLNGKIYYLLWQFQEIFKNISRHWNSKTCTLTFIISNG